MIIHNHIVESATDFEELFDDLGVAAVDLCDMDAELMFQNPKAALRIFANDGKNMKPIALSNAGLDIFERGNKVANQRISTVAQRITQLPRLCLATRCKPLKKSSVCTSFSQSVVVDDCCRQTQVNPPELESVFAPRGDR